MNKPTLVIMAAGMGSRFGGCKQITPVDADGHIIIDYSIYDAVRAGFGSVVCVIKPEMESDFRAAIGDRIAEHVDLHYAYQTIDRLPAGYSVPEGRTKPWGTAHAVLCAKDLVSGAFAAINADDFYGAGAFREAARFLSAPHAENEHAMVAYRVENTLTENGSVSRGVCTVKDGLLSGIVERTQIVPCEGGAKFIEGAEETFLPAGTPVSMNMWAFSHSMLEEMESRFPAWLDENVAKDPLKCEYFLPLIPNLLIQEGKGSVRVLNTTERWYGVTYHADLEKVQAAIEQMRASGQYPRKLWK
ncbi:MAG: sugar phosphate nucleotidyltransferase [Candidatus Faecivicinus sp.]|nr:sugar phosphate nucleotidyltransferase [Candidatus Faecivicinus sp.]